MEPGLFSEDVEEAAGEEAPEELPLTPGPVVASDGRPWPLLSLFPGLVFPLVEDWPALLPVPEDVEPDAEVPEEVEAAVVLTSVALMLPPPV